MSPLSWLARIPGLARLRQFGRRLRLYESARFGQFSRSASVRVHGRIGRHTGSARLPRPAVVRVRGRSMLPTYREGDLLLVIRGVRPRPGRAAVVRLPPDRDGAPRPLAVKRVTGRDPDDPGRWWVDSDNPAEGVTSFDIGSLAAGDIEAVVAGVLRRPLG